MGSAGKLKTLVTDFVWAADVSRLSHWRAVGFGTLRLCWVVVRDFAEGQISLRAMSLVYTTLLSLIPLLAISFSVLKGFGVHNQIEPFLFRFLAPLGEKGVEIGTRIVEFVENVKAGVLGSIGLGLLIYTVISLMQKIERAFNFIWHVPQQRPFAQRFSGYLSVIVIGPVLVFSSLGITASLTSTSVVVALTSIEPFGTAIRMLGSILPYVLVVSAFTFIYLFMPNTRVHVSAALVGAAVAGLLWDIAGWAFASFVANAPKYTAIYSAFAALIIFMIWLYVSWLILLIGANIAFYRQHPEYLMPERGEFRLSARLREKLALATAAAITADFNEGRPAPGTDALATRLRMPVTAVNRVLIPMESSGFFTRTDDEPPGWLPARPPETIPVTKLLQAVRSEGESSVMSAARLVAGSGVDDTVARLDAALESAMADTTLKDIAVFGATPTGTAIQPDQDEQPTSQRITAG